MEDHDSPRKFISKKSPDSSQFGTRGSNRRPFLKITQSILEQRPKKQTEDHFRQVLESEDDIAIAEQESYGW